MNKKEFAEYRRMQDAFRETEIGRLFLRFEAAHGHAWVTDSTSNSDQSMAKAWDKSNAGRAALVAKLAEVAGG